jgi:hypothetical protein
VPEPRRKQNGKTTKDNLEHNASAVTAEVAKKCSALTAKAFPPRVIGNPAAGSAKGLPQEQQNYFKRCVANGGNVADDNDARKEEK